VRTAVGDRYVLEEMLKNGYVLGGENSGHIICLEKNTTGDGLFAAIMLLNTLYKRDRTKKTPVSEFTGVVNNVPQIIVNAKVSNERKNEYLDDPVIRERCRRIETLFNDEGRVLIRPSGTEPLVRVMIESNDRELIETEAEGLARLIEARLA
jgi:phosphoglucosamine mutase